MQLLTVKELAERLKVKEKTLYAMAAQGLIPHYRIGKLLRFRNDEIDAWMETKRAETAEKRIAKITRSLYTLNIGRPDHLKERKVV